MGLVMNGISRTDKEALATIVPAAFVAVQEYVPSSMVFTLVMKNTCSSVDCTCIRRSRAAGKS